MNADDVASFLTEHPDFFEHYPALLAAIQVPHPQNGQAISLVERQSFALRERIRALETRMAALVRNGADNDVTVDRLVAWAGMLLAESDAARRPALAVAELQRVFEVPYAALRLWRIARQYAGFDWAAPVDADVMRLATSMAVPFCGANAGFEAARWMLPQAGRLDAIQSLALLPLRATGGAEPFGLLVLGSPDRERFQITMGTAFLGRLSTLLGAALAPLGVA